MNNICVYCSSSSLVSQIYYQEAFSLGQLMGENKYTLIYGGLSTGLMGEIAHSVYVNGGKIISVIPESIKNRGITYEKADYIIYTKNLRERKAIMEYQSEAFIALPGGFGTLEEILEIITLKQLQMHNKPIVFINTNGFYDNLLGFFATIFKESFAKDVYQNLYSIVPDASSAIESIQNYQPVEFESKWF